MPQSVTSIQPFGQGMAIGADSPASYLVLRDFRNGHGVSWEMVELSLGASPWLHCVPMSPEWKGPSCPLVDVVDVPQSRCRTRHEAGAWGGCPHWGSQEERPGQPTLTGFFRGCGTSTRPSQDERYFICASRNNETKCGIWVLVSGRVGEKV